MRQIDGVQIRFLLGPAGSGKTFHCLQEIRAELDASPEGLPLLLVAPKQATFQLERQILSDPEVPGYTRLHVLSFERMALFFLRKLKRPPVKLLSEEGRIMVLRSIVEIQQSHLRIFRGSAGSPGFIRELSATLHDLERHGLTPTKLTAIASELKATPLFHKLSDLALLSREYSQWLQDVKLQDPSQLLVLATAAIRQAQDDNAVLEFPLSFRSLWLDGFAELTAQELDFLAALLPLGEQATLAFCLDPAAPAETWLSVWTTVRRTVERCRERLAAAGPISEEILDRVHSRNRFAHNRDLAALEKGWSDGFRFSAMTEAPKAVRIVCCDNPEAEATFAAREINRFVRQGARYRETAVMVRDLAGYHDIVKRVFRKYQIPFFVDLRPAVGHHPFAEFNRNVLRTVAYGWSHEDWFATLKSGLGGGEKGLIDELENLALARGWSADFWQSGNREQQMKDLSPMLQQATERLLAPYRAFVQICGQDPDGSALANALERLWDALRIPQALAAWTEEETASPSPFQMPSMHSQVWELVRNCVSNIGLAFANRSMPLSSYVDVLESALAGLTIGVIPPSLDQVLVGSVDRSRNPDLRLCCLLGLNDRLFPKEPSSTPLLSNWEDEQLERASGGSRLSLRGFLARERFYGYIAFTRAREKLALTHSLADSAGRALLPSLFLSGVRKLFPGLAEENFSLKHSLERVEHSHELAVSFFQQRQKGAEAIMSGRPSIFDSEEFLPMRSALESIASFADETISDLSQLVAERLYGPVLKTSVSRIEQFAACPFRFFVHSGLQGRERVRWEADARQEGSLQHEVLRRFHEHLQQQSRAWRSLEPEEARSRIMQLTGEVAKEFADGLFQSSAANRFAATSVARNLGNFIAVIIGWMDHYRLDPWAVEVAFGYEQNSLPPWELSLDEKHKLHFRGKIDRIDIFVSEDKSTVWCAVIDYKSRSKQLDTLLCSNGIQLQLPAYLNVLRRVVNCEKTFGVQRLIPAGVFYVSLRGRKPMAKTRDEVLEGGDAAAYVHTGRFDQAALHLLDARADKTAGIQFKYRIKKNGEPDRRSRDLNTTEEFHQFLGSTEAHLVRMGKEIYRGNIQIDPYEKGNERACDVCDYLAICRLRPWTHRFRSLKRKNEA